MQTTWFITANAGRARIFSETDPKEPLLEVSDMDNATVRLHDADYVSDKVGPKAAGKSSHGIGAGEGASGAPNKTYQPAQTPSEHEAEQFARDISEYLLQAHQEGRFRHLVISASPEFLGALRSVLDPQLKSLVTLEVNKDYTQYDAQQLRTQLHAQMHKPH